SESARQVLVVAVLAAALAIPVGVFAFAGPRISLTIWGWLGPLLLPPVVGLAAAGSTVITQRLSTWSTAGPPRWQQAILVLASALLAAALVALPRQTVLGQIGPVVAAVCGVALLGTMVSLSLVLPERLLSTRVVSGVIWVLLAVVCVVAAGAMRPGNGVRFELSRSAYMTGAVAPVVWAAGGGASGPFDGVLKEATVDWAQFAPYGTADDVPAGLRAAARGKNVLVIAVDALRADYVTRAPETTALGKLWRSSLRFERTFVCAPDTRLSVSGLIQGRSHPTRDHDASLFSGFATAGYRTAMVAPAFVLERTRARTDLNVVDHVAPIAWDESLAGVERLKALNDSIAADANQWLHESDKPWGDKPWVLWLHLFATHEWSSIPGTDPHERYAQGLAMDEATIASFLEGLRARGLEQDTVVVLVSDHGEGLGDRGWMTHTVHVHPELIHIPMSIRVPGVAPAGVQTSIAAISLPATLRDLFGFPAAESKEGASLLPLLTKEQSGAPRPIVIRGIGHDAVIHGDWFFRFDNEFRAASLIALGDLYSFDPVEHFSEQASTAMRMFGLLYE
ncbi:MAG: hypothetical protein ACI9WU_004076, partial [Myxococcota bacterium]